MKYIALLAGVLFGSIMPAQAVDTASTVCNTVKYSVFGEAEKTFRDCLGGPAFVVITSINGHVIEKLGVGLELPSTAQTILANDAVTTVVQVLKKREKYLVRAQVVKNRKSFMLSEIMSIGGTNTKIIDGDNFSVTLLSQG